jgi:hypothetical protein
VNTYGSEIWGALEGLRYLKALEIITHRVPGRDYRGNMREDSVGGELHVPLFQIVEKLGTLEEFTLLDAITMQTVGMARSVAWLWPGTLKKVPRNRVKGRQSDWSDYS